MLQITRASQENIDKIIEIENASFSNPWATKQISESIDKTYIAKEEDKIKAFICLENILDETHILHMAVHPEFRKQGIAKEMMAFALNFPSKKLFLEVRESNLSAQKLYESFGFKVISQRKNYYQDNNETALVMECKKNG